MLSCPSNMGIHIPSSGRPCRLRLSRRIIAEIIFFI
jgi:hypothetical protein